MELSQNEWKPGRSWTVFALLTALQLWFAHAVAFFTHEYAHSFTAWLLGWKANPLLLHYGHPSLAVLLVQRGINENVNYAPIFAGGHGDQAGIIAAAGMIIGNAFLTYPLSLWVYGIARRHGSRSWAMLSYWLCVASIGNFIDYVPVRTFAYEDDMHTVVLGFGCSPWLLLLVFGVPFAVAFIHFFGRFEPNAVAWIFPRSAARRGVVVFLTAFALFGFYGAAGWDEDYGSVSHWMSVISVCAFVPLMAIVGWLLTHRRLRALDEAQLHSTRAADIVQT
jgi:hypothetical protein